MTTHARRKRKWLRGSHGASGYGPHNLHTVECDPFIGYGCGLQKLYGCRLRKSYWCRVRKPHGCRFRKPYGCMVRTSWFEDPHETETWMVGRLPRFLRLRASRPPHVTGLTPTKRGSTTLSSGMRVGFENHMVVGSQTPGLKTHTRRKCGWLEGSHGASGHVPRAYHTVEYDPFIGYGCRLQKTYGCRKPQGCGFETYMGVWFENPGLKTHTRRKRKWLAGSHGASGYGPHARLRSRASRLPHGGSPSCG